MMHTTTGQIEVNGGMLYYETAGEGEAVVLAHAGFLDSRMFDAQWDALAQRFRVIRYDMQGYGRSSAAQAPVCRREELRQLLAHLGVTRAHFVGASLGGSTALDLALEQPELALSLTLVNAAPDGFEMQGEPPRYLMEMFGALQNGEAERASELQTRIWFDGSFREPDEVDRALRDKALAMNRIPVERSTYLVAEMQPACPLDPPSVTRLGEVACPALIVTSALDHPEVRRAAALMAETIPAARLVVVEDAAHVPSFERPDVFNGLLLDFLAEAQQVSRR